MSKIFKIVLYVEDDEIIRDSLSYVFQNIFDKVLVAKNGYEALEIFKQNNIDLIFTDIDMPIMDGIEFIKSVREIDLNIKIIICSGKNRYELQKELNSLNILHFFQKPLIFKDIEEIKEMI